MNILGMRTDPEYSGKGRAMPAYRQVGVWNGIVLHYCSIADKFTILAILMEVPITMEFYKRESK